MSYKKNRAASALITFAAAHLFKILIGISAILQAGIIILYPPASGQKQVLCVSTQPIKLIHLIEITEPIEDNEAVVQKVLSDDIEEIIAPRAVKEIITPESMDHQNIVMSSYMSVYSIDVLPRPVVFGKKTYPSAAREKAMEGKVILEVFLDAQGNVVDILIIKKAGYGFERAAIDYIKTAKFTPAEHKGQKVPVRMRYPVTFSLTD